MKWWLKTILGFSSTISRCWCDREAGGLHNSIPTKAVGAGKSITAFFSLIAGVQLTQLYRICRILGNKVCGYCWFYWFPMQESLCCCTVSVCPLLCKDFWKLANWFDQIGHRLRVFNNNYVPTSFVKTGSQRERDGKKDLARSIKGKITARGKSYSKRSPLISH